MIKKKQIVLGFILIILPLVLIPMFLASTFSTKLVAHRGGSLAGVENTEEAFLTAIKHGAKYLECDIRPTKDRELIIFHDSVLDDFVGENHPLYGIEIEDLNYDEIKDVDLHQNGYTSKILTFKKYLDICKEYKVNPVIELKGDFDEVLIKEVHTYIKDYKFLSSVTVISFDLDYLLMLREIDANIKLQNVCQKGVWDEIDICVEKKIDIDVNWPYCTKKLVNYCHKNGLKINVWTVNSDLMIYYYQRIGVDYITTDVKMHW